MLQGYTMNNILHWKADQWDSSHTLLDWVTLYFLTWLCIWNLLGSYQPNAWICKSIRDSILEQWLKQFTFNSVITRNPTLDRCRFVDSDTAVWLWLTLTYLHKVRMLSWYKQRVDTSRGLVTLLLWPCVIGIAQKLLLHAWWLGIEEETFS